MKPAGFPFDAVIFLLERAVDHMGEMVQDHEIEIAPDQFSEPHRGAAAAFAGTHGFNRATHQRANRHGAKAQVDRKAGRSRYRRIVARGVVIGHAQHEIVEQLLAAVHAGRDAQCRQVGWRKAQIRKRGDRSRLRRQRGQRARLRFAGKALKYVWIRLAVQAVRTHQFPEPCILVGRKNRQGLAHHGAHLLLLENGLVLEAFHAAAGLVEFTRYPAVALDGGRFIVAIHEYRVDAELRGKRRDFVLGAGMADDQSTTLAKQGAVQLDDAGEDEFHTTVDRARTDQQGIEDGRIEYEGAVHLPAAGQRGMQRGMVEVAQVAAKPDQDFVDCFHVGMEEGCASSGE
jgi:hypothetical protein